MGFTKLDSRIIDSSLWNEPPETRVVWITLLAKANCKGVVLASRSALLRSANIPETDFDKAMATLEAPDPESRTPTEDGKRIIPIQGGWRIVNYLKYRRYSYSDNPESERVRAWRLKHKQPLQSVTCNNSGGGVTLHSASASASSTGNLKLSNAEIVVRDKELSRVLERMKAIRGKYDANHPWSTEDKTEWGSLKTRRDELRGMLGVQR